MGRLSSYVAVLSNRGKLLVFMNLLFFGSVFITVVVLNWYLPPPFYGEHSSPFPHLLQYDPFWQFWIIFINNLIVSSFLIITLPGFAFFPLSGALLAFRAYIWGELIYNQPPFVLLAALPVIVLEGLAYTIAAVSGIVVGMSWIKPRWLYTESVGRKTALKKSAKEFLILYLFIIFFLFIAAIAEVMFLFLY